jgi:hypothetical protein
MDNESVRPSQGVGIMSAVVAASVTDGDAEVQGQTTAVTPRRKSRLASPRVHAAAAAPGVVAPRSSARPMDQAEYTRRNRRRRRMVEKLEQQMANKKGR